MVAIIDYGVGNLFSLMSSLNYVGIKNKLTDRENIIKKSDAIILPGVGAFRDAIEKLEKKNCGILKATLIEESKKGKIILGICLGMQMAVVEFARDVLGLKDANSEEFDENTKNPVIHIMDDQKNIENKGGTMRLGSYPCVLKEGTKAFELYGKKEIAERHRHRFEYNNDYKEKMEEAGLICSGTSPDGRLVEIVELKDHPFFIAGQFHPEFKSRPNRPGPLFKGLIAAAKK